MSSLKYNVELVTDLVPVDSNTITGKIGDSTIEIKRRMNGWNVNLVIVIDGLLMHDDAVTPECRVAFERLLNRAWSAKESATKATRAKSLPALTKFIEIIN